MNKSKICVINFEEKNYSEKYVFKLHNKKIIKVNITWKKHFSSILVFFFQLGETVKQNVYTESEKALLTMNLGLDKMSWLLGWRL